MGGKEALQVAHGVFADCHLTQVVFPHIGFDGAAGEWLTVDSDDFSFAVHAGIGCRRNDEVHLCTFLPEGAGEVVREDQGKVATFGGKEGNCLFRSRPFRMDVGLVPTPKFEAIGVGLADENEQSLCSSHSTFSKFTSQNFLACPAELSAWLKGMIAAS